MKLHRKSSHAFTIIELTIVLGIVAILATVAISRFSGFTAKARRVEAQSVLAGIATAELVTRFSDTYIMWACSFDALPLKIDGLTTVSANELKGTNYTYQLACDSSGNYWATATGNTDGDGWLDVAVSTPSTRFALRYDDVFDTYNELAGAIPATTPVASTPAPTSTPAATPAPTSTPTNGNSGNSGNNGNSGSSGNSGNGNSGNGNSGNGNSGNNGNTNGNNGNHNGQNK